MQSKKKIFITEDEFIISKNLEVKLISFGYDVIGTAPSGELAIEKIRKQQPDLVLMDIMLAGKLDGIETAGIITSEFDIPIVFLTAYSSQEIFKRAAITEPYAYIIKPFNERELEINISIALYKYNIEAKFLKKQQELEQLNNYLDKLVEDGTENLLLETSKKHKAEDIKQRFFKIIEQTSDHVIITNAEGIIEYVNPAIVSFSGYTTGELIGGKPNILGSGVYDQNYFSNLWSTILRGDSFSDNVINRKKNGDIFISDTTIISLKDQFEKVTHYASVSRDITKKKEFEKKLNDIQEDERGRISKGLHDGVGQSIAAIKLGLGIIIDNDQGQDKVILEELKKQVNGLTDTIREISYNLMPSILNDYGLVSALNKSILILDKNSHLTIDFLHPKEIVRFRSDIELALFRITQEAISNCIKHSNAKSLIIRLAYNHDLITLEIEDDGNGFNDKIVNPIENGQGIFNMKHRALLLNGTFSISSIINVETIVKIRIPYEK
jgi:PAS domain S-box-containing protein